MKYPTVFIFLLLLPAGASALTLDEALSEVLANNADLRAAQHAVERARGRLVQAGLWPNPDFALSAATDRGLTNENESRWGAELMQAFPLAGRLRLAHELSREDVALAIAEIRNRERLILAETQRTYLAAVAASAQIAARQELHGELVEYVAVTEKRLAAAQASQVDVSVARIEAQRVEQELRHLEIERDSALLALAAKLGRPPGAGLRIDTNLAGVAAGLAKFSGSEIAYRPEIHALELAANRAAAEVRLARAEAWGDLRAGVTFESERSRDEPEGVGRTNFIGGKLSIPLPLWNRNQGRVIEQQANAQEASAQLAALRLSIRHEIADAGQRAQKLRTLVETYETKSLPLAAESVRTLNQAYGQGLATLQQLFQAQSQRVALRSAYFQTVRDYAHALADLRAARGAFPQLERPILQSTSRHSLK